MRYYVFVYFTFTVQQIVDSTLFKLVHRSIASNLCMCDATNIQHSLTLCSVWSAVIGPSQTVHVADCTFLFPS